MLLADVNVLVYAYRADAPDHQAYRDWLDGMVNGDEAYGLSNLVLSGVLRVLTHPRVFNPPSSIADALAFLEAVRSGAGCVAVEPGPRHWEIFTRLCRRVGAKGNHVPDAWLAALAIESGSEWLTSDRGFARFPGLRWRHPLD
jgi:toxin-antitoxin system PIN domain toxin